MPSLHPHLTGLALALATGAPTTPAAPAPAELALAARAATPPGPAARDGAEELADWLAEFGRDRAALAPSTRERYVDLLEDVGRDAAGRSSDAVPARLALLRAAGWGLEGSQAPETAAWIRETAQAELSERLAPGRGRLFLDWILYELLSFPDRHEPMLRAVALRALEARLAERDVEPHLLVAIMAAGRERDGFVRLTVADILKDRSEGFVSDYLLGALERGEVTPELFDAHLAALPRPAFEAFWEEKQLRVFDYVRLRLESPDWREASRGLALAPRFETARMAPLLITGLGVWGARDTGGTRRVRSEYRSALKALTGRDHGTSATSWARWWRTALEGGTIPEPDPGRTEATFYGLRPASDRVLFLIDRSGSMRERLEGKDSRFEDAIERLLYTLRDLGPETRFRVVLFNNRAQAFRQDLVPASDTNLTELERWAARITPDGGTSLHAGLYGALPGLAGGPASARALDVDTVIVLCDGETESATWVAPWLAAHNLEARLRFHCVNIGGTPGGVLEALAAGSGGSFVAVETH